MNQQAKKLLLVSAVLGLVCGLGIDLFIRLLRFVTDSVWAVAPTTASNYPILAIIIAVIGGTLMGLCVKYFGTNPGVGFEAVLVSVKQDGELGLKQIKRVVINAFVGLVTGASIGPENPITVVGGFIGDWIAKRLKLAKEQVLAMIMIAVGGSLGILLNTPVAGPVLLSEKRASPDEEVNKMLIFASMIAASFGYGVYLVLGAPLISAEKLVPAYGGFEFVHLIYGLIIGVLGTLIGLALKYLIEHLEVIFARLFQKKYVLRGAAVGLFVGICAAAFPLVRFDGSAQLQQLVQNSAEYGVFMLLTLAVVRLLTTAVALSGGYQGGNIFPTIFISGAVGLAIHAIFPFIPAPVAMIACMVPAMYVFLPLPLFTIFLFTEISSFALIPVMALALTSGYLIMMRIDQHTSRSQS